MTDITNDRGIIQHWMMMMMKMMMMMMMMMMLMMMMMVVVVVVMVVVVMMMVVVVMIMVVVTTTTMMLMVMAAVLVHCTEPYRNSKNRCGTMTSILKNRHGRMTLTHEYDVRSTEHEEAWDG